MERVIHTFSVHTSIMLRGHIPGFWDGVKSKLLVKWRVHNKAIFFLFVCSISFRVITSSIVWHIIWYFREALKKQAWTEFTVDASVLKLSMSILVSINILMYLSIQMLMSLSMSMSKSKSKPMSMSMSMSIKPLYQARESSLVPLCLLTVHFLQKI